MAARSRQVSLTALAARSALPDVAEPDALPAEAPRRDVSPAAASESMPTSPRPPEAPPAPERRSPRRKATRPAPGEWARFDQYGRLSTTSRELNRTRRGRGERITENTLIRVAIDLLLERGDELTGTTEAELRKSVGL